VTARHVAGHEPGTRVARIPIVGLLDDDLAVAVGVEAQDPNATISGQPLDLGCRLLAHRRNTALLVQPVDERAGHHRHRALRLGHPRLPGFPRLELRDRQHALVMDGPAEHGHLAIRAPHRDAAQAARLGVLTRHSLAGIGWSVQQRIERPRQQRGGRVAEPALDAGAGLRDRPRPGVDGEQKPVGLDAVRPVDRLVGAREVPAAGRIDHEGSPVQSVG